MNAGDLLVVHCWCGLIPYSHYGIDMGDGTVVHLSSDPERSPSGGFDLQSMRVRQTSLSVFSGGRAVHVVEVEEALPAAVVLDRTRSKLGTAAYCLVSANCEHFARWCKSGIWVSEQVHETRQSLARMLTHAAVLASGQLRHVRLQTALSGSARLSAMGRIALPSLIGEITEQVTRCSLKRCNASPSIVEQGGRFASFGTVAVLGLVCGGPSGSASAIVSHTLARMKATAKGPCSIEQRPPAS